jgi:hypothetical protein
VEDDTFEVAGHLRGAGEVDKLLLPVSRGGV